jgi:hypothetical protein
MQYQCPQCYGYEIVTAKPRGIFAWVAAILVVNVAILFLIFSGAVENLVALIVGFAVVDLLLTLFLMRAVRSRSQYPNGAVYQCRACGYTWTETNVPETGPADATASGIPVTAISSSTSGFHMTVEDVFFIKGRGTVVTGRVESGTIVVGETVELHSASGIQQIVVDGIEMFHKTLSRAEAGNNVGIFLRNVGKDNVQRGDVLKGGGW